MCPDVVVASNVSSECLALWTPPPLCAVLQYTGSALQSVFDYWPVWGPDILDSNRKSDKCGIFNILG